MKFLWFMLSCLCGLAQNPADLMATHQILWPTQVAGLKLWVYAGTNVFKDTSGTPCADGDTVVQWRDMSGNGNDLGNVNAGRGPRFRTGAINGLPALDFWNTPSAFNALWLSNTFATFISQPITTFMVYYPSNNGVSPNPATIHCGFGSVSPTVQIGNNGVHLNWFEASAPITVKLLNPQMKQWNQTTCMYFGGASRFESFSGKFSIQNPGTGNWTNIIVGGLANSDPPTNPNSPYQGKLAELIIVEGLMTDSQRYGVEMYLKQKYAFPQPF